MDLHNSNKALANLFYSKIIGQRDTSLVNTLIAEDYIQHNPTIPTGRAGVLMALEYLKQMPKPENPVNPIQRVFAEGDFVVMHLNVEMPGMKKAVIDLFRIENGQFAEHWDCMQDQPEKTVNGHSMTDGESEIQDLTLTQTNKETVSRFYQEVFVNQNLGNIASFIDGNLIQHHPEIENGLSGLQKYLSKTLELEHRDAPTRIIGEGNFVFVQSGGKINKTDFVFNDIFRLKNQRIVEQWSVKQEVPSQLAHGNGMI